MIEKITLTNFLSFKNETTFDFSASQEKEKKGFEYMNWFEEINDKKVLKTQFLFGNNGTGKSNFIAAIAVVKSLVCDYTKSKSNYPLMFSNCAFKLSKETMNQPSCVKIIFTTKGTRYFYEIKWVDNAIISERLEKNKGKTKKASIFIRSFDSEKDITIVSFPSREIKREVQNVIVENAIKNSSVISIYDGMNIESFDLRNVYNYFRTIKIVPQIDRIKLSNLLEKRKDGDKLRSILLSLLGNIGSNIIDYKIDSLDVRIEENEARVLRSLFGEELFSKEYPNGYRKVKSVQFGHHADTEGGISWLREEEESLGTINTIKLIITLYDSCIQQTPIFIDECSYGIHQMTFGRIIQFFLSVSHRTQAIMASQNLAIMEMDGFRRDTIKIFDKNRETGETFCQKVDLRAYHKNLNIVKKYLDNSFGGLPKFPPVEEWVTRLQDYKKIIESN